MLRENIGAILNAFAAIAALLLCGAIITAQMFIHSDNVQKHNDSVAYTSAMNRYADALENASNTLDREK